jgi:hypothetical protein
MVAFPVAIALAFGGWECQLRLSAGSLWKSRSGRTVVDPIERYEQLCTLCKDDNLINNS